LSRLTAGCATPSTWSQAWITGDLATVFTDPLRKVSQRLATTGARASTTADPSVVGTCAAMVLRAGVRSVVALRGCVRRGPWGRRFLLGCYRQGLVVRDCGGWVGRSSGRCRSFPDGTAMRLSLTLAAVGSLPACSRNHTDVKAGPETGAVSTTDTTQTPRPPPARLIPARLPPIPAPGDSSPTRQREASIRPASPRACRTAPPGCGIIRLDGREMTAVLLP